MIRGFLDIIAQRSERRSRVQRLVLTEPLQRFKDVQYFGSYPTFQSVARSLAKQTHAIVESLLSDDAIPDWARVADSATPQQLTDLAILCSHCLMQFTIKNVNRATTSGVDAGASADLSDLVHLMYGYFATKSPSGAITFEESLQCRNLEDDLDIRDLTRLLDQLMGIEGRDNSHREIKINKLRDLLTSHAQAFAYRVHGIHATEP